LKCRVPPLWPSYVAERRTTFAKAHGIKVRCYTELFGEHVRNLGTLCFDPSPPTPNKKKREAPSLHGPTSYWLIPKIGWLPIF